MTEYIDRDKVIDLLKQYGKDAIDKGRKTLDIVDDAVQIMRDVEKILTADVVEVVRCKDCKKCYEKRTKRNKQLMLFCMRMDGREYQVNANDFCSYGVRKGDNNG